VLALVWHINLALLERSRNPKAKPRLKDLLLLAEADLLRALRNELRHYLHFKREHGKEQKLLEVERRLKELNGNER
jgi:hypothetical protein